MFRIKLLYEFDRRININNKHELTNRYINSIKIYISETDSYYVYSAIHVENSQSN